MILKLLVEVSVDLLLEIVGDCLDFTTHTIILLFIVFLSYYCD